MADTFVNVDGLMDIVNKGGYVKTGVDVFDHKGVLLIAKNIPVESLRPLEVIKKYGNLPASENTIDSNKKFEPGMNIFDAEAAQKMQQSKTASTQLGSLEKKIKEINEKKKIAAEKYDNAKNSIKKVISDIQETGGEFEVEPVEETVNEILNFLTLDETAFSYLSKEIFSYDDYLYNHSVNACTIGTAVLIRFNEKFGEIVNNYLNTISIETLDRQNGEKPISFIYYLPEELHDIAMGYFLHDVGKVLIPDNILNKKGKLTDDEFAVVKRHSYEKGMQILEKNKLSNPFISNTVKYHHGLLYPDEKGCYPEDKHPIELPPYVKISKLADIYDAMTSRRCYKEAFNPVGVVTEIFRKYTHKDRMLQFILRAFAKVVGIYPAGSVLSLKNGQMVYILDSGGPIVIPFTDTRGNPLKVKPEPLDLSEIASDSENELNIDRRKPLKSPLEVFHFLPPFLRDMIGDEA
jgi:HD-GYP domain-containing protein (c-di-GMP phosphodiesterase class II)